MEQKKNSVYTERPLSQRLERVSEQSELSLDKLLVQSPSPYEGEPSRVALKWRRGAALLKRENSYTEAYIRPILDPPQIPQSVHYEAAPLTIETPAPRSTVVNEERESLDTDSGKSGLPNKKS